MSSENGKKLNSLPFIVFMVALGINIAASIRFARRNGVSRVPMQWNAHGDPTWAAPRIIGLWASSAVTLIVGAFLAAIAQYDPSKVSTLWLSATLMSVAAAATQIWHLRAVERWSARA